MKETEKKKQMNLHSAQTRQEFSRSGKNTLKSRIHAMDKGWIEKKKEIKNMNRSIKKLEKNVLSMGGVTRL